MKIIATAKAPRSAMPPIVAPAMIPAFLEPSLPPLDGEGEADVVVAAPGNTVVPDDVVSSVVAVEVGSSENVGSKSVVVAKREKLALVVGPEPWIVPGLVAYKVSPV